MANRFDEVTANDTAMMRGEWNALSFPRAQSHTDIKFTHRGGLSNPHCQFLAYKTPCIHS